MSRDVAEGDAVAYEPRELAAWTGGTWSTHRVSAAAGVSIDTRTLRPGQIYVAIRGLRFDGHAFVEDAFAKGAASAMVDEHGAALREAVGPLLVVADTRTALVEIARGHRARLSGRMVGVTGSVGKTTVKELLAQALARVGATCCTEGNWNNDIGLPLSLLRMRPDARFGVFEIGMSKPGELAPLCALLQPGWAITTTIGLAHAEGFARIEDIVQEKMELFRSLPAGGAAIYCRDQCWTEALRTAAAGQGIEVSLEGDADYRAVEIARDQTSFEVVERDSGERAQFSMSRPGRFMVENSLLAIAAARSLGADWPVLQDAVAQYQPLPMRWQPVACAGRVVINDAYNANPLSMRAALDAFAETPCSGNRWLVLGGMLELGAREKAEHQALGTVVAGGAWAGVVTLGALGDLVAEGAEAAGWPVPKLFRCGHHLEVARLLDARTAPGDAVLLKGSRGIELEKVIACWEACSRETE